MQLKRESKILDFVPLALYSHLLLAQLISQPFECIRQAPKIPRCIRRIILLPQVHLLQCYPH